MKATRERGSRTIKITQLPGTLEDKHSRLENLPTEVEIQIKYKDTDDCVGHAISLDNQIIPAIVEALNKNLELAEACDLVQRAWAGDDVEMSRAVDACLLALEKCK